MEREKSPKLNEITVADKSELLCMKPSEEIIPVSVRSCRKAASSKCKPDAV